MKIVEVGNPFELDKLRDNAAVGRLLNMAPYSAALVRIYLLQSYVAENEEEESRDAFTRLEGAQHSASSARDHGRYFFITETPAFLLIPPKYLRTELVALETHLASAGRPFSARPFPSGDTFAFPMGSLSPLRCNDDFKLQKVMEELVRCGIQPEFYYGTDRWFEPIRNSYLRHKSQSTTPIESPLDWQTEELSWNVLRMTEVLRELERAGIQIEGR